MHGQQNIKIKIWFGCISIQCVRKVFF